MGICRDLFLPARMVREHIQRPSGRIILRGVPFDLIAWSAGALKLLRSAGVRLSAFLLVTPPLDIMEE
jgi:hypothetical protein